MPDWLTDTAEPIEPETTALPDEPVAATTVPEAEAELDDMPAWLTDLSDAAEPIDEPAALPDEPIVAPAEPEAELDDMPTWLADLPDTAEPSVEAQREELPVSTEIAGDDTELEMPSWLSDLAEADEAGPTSAADVSASGLEPAAPEPPAETTEISELPPAPGSDTAVTDSETERPDWLAGLPDTAELVEPVMESVETETPDWLADITITDDQAATLDAADDEEEPVMPDWLSKAPAAADTGPLGAPADLVADDQEEPERPDWLSQISEAPDTGILPSAPAAPDTAQPEEEAEMPAWISEMPEAPDTGILSTPSSPTAAAGADDELEMPDWLAEVPEAPDTGPLTMPAGQADRADIEADLGSVSTEPGETGVGGDGPQPIVQPIPADDDSETPQWLSDLTREIDTAPGPEDVTETVDAEAGLDRMTPIEPEAAAELQEDLELPDWLASSIEETPAAVSPQADVTAAETEAALSGEERDESEPTVSEKAVSGEPEADDETSELPDWLANASPDVIAEILAELDGLSDEEVQQLLDQETQDQED
jgi:hypothetical protein